MDAFTPEQRANLTLRYLRDALRCAKAAGSPRTTERIRLAISSAKGAIRACSYRASRLERK